MSQFGRFKTSEEVAKHAESCGFEVIHGDATTLLLDLDSGEDFHRFELNRDAVDKLVGIEDYTVWNSQSGKHHVKLKLKKPLEIKERMILQACLGSDLKRELATYARLLEGETEPIMLFRPRKWGNSWKRIEGAKATKRINQLDRSHGQVETRQASRPILMLIDVWQDDPQMRPPTR